jgi:hypothetical protein
MVNRITPQGPSRAYQTHEVLAPLATHWRRATCEEIDCGEYRNGWRLRVDALTPKMLADIDEVGYRYTRLPVAPGETYLIFEAGQPCFKASQHQAPLGKPGIYRVRQGDWRMPVAGVHTFATPEDWRDHLGEHLGKIADLRQRG